MSPADNERAFLALIRFAEGTDRAADPYRVCYGYRHTIVDLSDHPAITGEWKGEKLTDEQCKGAGKGPGCVSTAAGAYQVIRPTWVALRGTGVELRDFGPEAQDRAALALIKSRGALPFVHAGEIAQAVRLCRREWASLPGAGYAGQPQRGLQQLLATYARAGGFLVTT